MGFQGRALASLRRSARNRDHIPQWGRGGGTVYAVVSHSHSLQQYEYTTQSLLTSHFSLSLCFSTLVYRVKFIFRCFSWMETFRYYSTAVQYGLPATNSSDTPRTKYPGT